MLSIYQNNYEINTKKRYLVYFLGNFSIPHKGHLYMIEKFLNKNNIDILISIFEDQNRHGISKEISLAIWNVYLKNINNVKITFFSNTYDNILEYKKIDKCLIIRGNEYGIDRGYIKRLYGNLIEILKNQKIKCDILLIDRIPDISSTEIKKNLFRLKEIKKYLPAYLSEKEIEYITSIIEKLSKK